MPRGKNLAWISDSVVLGGLQNFVMSCAGMGGTVHSGLQGTVSVQFLVLV